MGRSEPPFLYDPPTSRVTPGSPTRSFNPKSYTQASWAPSPPRPKKDGPLVNFNQHPDSFGLIANGRGKVKSMSPRTKQRVKYARWTQLALRILTLIGALGLLFCVICIKGTTLTLSWIIRVPPCVSIVHTIYGIYHLFRSAAARTPASSASYMLFASVLDAGLIPLYVFIGIVSNMEYEKKEYGWGTLFGTDIAKEKIIYTTFLTCSTVGGFHLISLLLDLYLAIIFRKISKLPPDMNPLEDHLTSRSHKRSKSELAEKHLSTNTVDSAELNRLSLAKEPLIQPRSIPFMHTRTDSASTLSGHHFQAPDSPRTSYYSAHSSRFSRSDLPSQQSMYFDAHKSKTDIARTPAQKRGTTSSRPQSAVLSANPDPVQGQQNLNPGEAKPRDPSGVSAISDENWCSYSSSPPSPELYPVDIAASASEMNMMRAQAPVSEDKWNHAETETQRGGDPVENYLGHYTSIDSPYDEENTYDNAHEEKLYVFEHDLGDNPLTFADEENDAYQRYLPINPLEMNPPTPRPVEQTSLSSRQSKGSLHRIALSDIPNPPADSGRSTPVKATKLRSYGELEQSGVSPAQRMGSLRGKDSKIATPNSTDKKKSRWRRKTGNFEVLDTENDFQTGHNNDEETESRDRKGRVVSNTGIDLGSGAVGYGNYIAGLGVGRRREVSGKVAEEGRGGSLGPGEDDSENKEKRLSNAGSYRAAGWARFKGL